jgi:hypothetical protein
MAGGACPVLAGRSLRLDDEPAHADRVSAGGPQSTLELPRGVTHHLVMFSRVLPEAREAREARDAFAAALRVSSDLHDSPTGEPAR